jgi:hypothetical protein
MRLRRARDLDALHDPALVPLAQALTAEATAQELAAEREALAAYRATTLARPGLLARPRFWRPAVLSTVLATKLGAAAAAGAVGLSGAAAAAYTGNLPDTLQDVAHRTIKAPPAHAKGPDASGPAAWGLCQAFAKDKAKEHGDQAEDKGDDRGGAATSAPKATDKPGKGVGRGNGNGNGKGNGADAQATLGDRGKSKERSVAYRNLVRAAGGEDKVEAYCAAVPRPSGEPDAEEGGEQAKPTKSPHATGKPSAADSQRDASPAAHGATAAPTAEPTDEPSSEPSAEPTDLPSPTATG